MTGDEEEPEQNSLDCPEGEALVRVQFLECRSMTRDLNEATFRSELRSDDWERYAISFSAAFRTLDTLLTQGAPFPHEWVIGEITTP